MPSIGETISGMGILGCLTGRATFGAVAATAVTAGATMIGAPATPGRAAPERARVIVVRLSPATAVPGRELRIVAFCGAGQTGMATTDLPGITNLPLAPGSGGITAVAQVPLATVPGKYTVSVVCGNADTGTASVWVITSTIPGRGPATGGGGTAGVPHPDGGPGVGAGLVGVVAGAGAVTLGLGMLAVRRRQRA